MQDISADRMIPAVITRQQLLTALEPLCALLNVTPKHFFSAPGLTISADRVTFLAPAPASSQDWESGRPVSRKADCNLGGLTAWSAELAQFVEIEVLG